MTEITCHHCHASDGFFTKEQVRGTATPHYTKEGHYASENGHIYDHLIHSGGHIAYCANCKKKIGNTKDLISGLSEEDVNTERAYRSQ